jgi:hypothetical protein
METSSDDVTRVESSLSPPLHQNSGGRSGLKSRGADGRTKEA